MRLPDQGRVRRPAVAGSFYPGDAAELARSVRGHLAAARSAAGRGSSPGGERDGKGAEGPSPHRAGTRWPKAIIAPHAGYIYSGPVAGSAFAALGAGARPLRRAVVLGPAHRVRWSGLALPESGRYSTPLGPAAGSESAYRRLAELPDVGVSEAPHLGEHSVEVEVPFLQELVAGIEVVPLVAGDASAETVARALEAVWGDEETVIVVSSDLSHFLDYDRARDEDAATAEAIVALEGGLDPRQACGAVPINGLLEVGRRRGLTAELLDLRSSGDTAGGPESVVGYGAFAFYEPEAAA